VKPSGSSLRAELSPARDKGTSDVELWFTALCLTNRRMRTRTPAPTAGAVCPVVWEGGSREAPPYPDYGTDLYRCLNGSTVIETVQSSLTSEADRGLVFRPRKRSVDLGIT